MLTAEMTKEFSGMGLSANSSNSLINNGMDVGVLRPYLEDIGGVNKSDMRAFVDLFVGMKVNDNGVREPVYKKVEIPVGNATLRKDEWLAFDDVVIREARLRLTFVDLLIRKGLVFNVNGMSKTALETESLNEFQAAQVTMDGVNRGTKDIPNFELAGIPLPITHKEFEVTLRTLNASRERGEALDTTSAELAGRQVAELTENTFVNGISSYKAAGYTLYGVTDHPNVNTGSLTANWDDSAASGTTILADVLSMKTAAHVDRMYGPYALLVPSNFEMVLDEDFKANSDKTIRQRLMEINSIEEVLIVDKLASDTVVLVQLTADVVRVINGLAPTTLQWDSTGGLLLNFKAMAIQVPQVRATQAGRSGIVVYT